MRQFYCFFFTLCLSVNLISQSQTVQKVPSCSNLLQDPLRFKSVDINRHTGSVGFIGEDDLLYYCNLDYNLIKPTLYKNTRLNIHSRTHYGYGIHISLNGYGPLTFVPGKGMVPVGEYYGVVALTNIPVSATFVTGDVGPSGLIWYIDKDGMIYSSISQNTVQLPKINAKQFTVYHNEFYALDIDNNLWYWKPEYSAWKNMNVKAKMINRDHSVGTQLYYVGTDDSIYQISDQMVPTKISDFKCRYLAVNGRQLHVIGLDGLYYVKMRNCWSRIDFAKI
jgi:hypothetical protein